MLQLQVQTVCLRDLWSGGAGCLFWLQRRVERRDNATLLVMARYLASEMVRARWPCHPLPKCELTEAALPLSSFCQTVSVA